MNLPRVLTFIVGLILVLSGVSVGGFIEQPDSKQRLEQARRFDTGRGQAGFILGAFRNRTVGITLMTVGATLLLICLGTARWDSTSRRRPSKEFLPYEKDRPW
jgi:hypothetical protein